MLFLKIYNVIDVEWYFKSQVDLGDRLLLVFNLGLNILYVDVNLLIYSVYVFRWGLDSFVFEVIIIQFEFKDFFYIIGDLKYKVEY